MKKILIVEDELAMSEILYDEFSRNGFEGSVARDGEEAMIKMRLVKPDFVLLDLLLPKMDGFEVLKLMKADENLQGIPLIVLSNLGQDDDIKEALKLGAMDYFVKTQHQIKEIIQKVQHFFSESV